MDIFEVLWIREEDGIQYWMVSQRRGSGQLEVIANQQANCDEAMRCDGQFRTVVAAGPAGSFDKYVGRTAHEIDY